ncbi:hypothetical protein D9M70_542090 [compost metagenome]
MPGLQFVDVPRTKQRHQLGIDLVGLHPLQLALCIAGDPRRIDHAQPITQPYQMIGEGFVVHVGRLHNDPGPRLGIFFQPLGKLPETSRIIAQVALGAVFAIGLQQGDIECPFGNINADNDGHRVLLNECSSIITTPDPTLPMRALA